MKRRRLRSWLAAFHLGRSLIGHSQTFTAGQEKGRGKHRDASSRAIPSLFGLSLAVASSGGVGAEASTDNQGGRGRGRMPTPRDARAPASRGNRASRRRGKGLEKASTRRSAFAEAGAAAAGQWGGCRHWRPVSCIGLVSPHLRLSQGVAWRRAGWSRIGRLASHPS